MAHCRERWLCYIPWYLYPKVWRHMEINDQISTFCSGFGFIYKFLHVIYECVFLHCVKCLLMWCVFLAAFSPYLNVIFRFSTISYFNHINLSSLLAPFPEGGGDRHIRLRSFLYEIQFRTTFIWSFFGCKAYFRMCSAQKSM